MARVTVEDCLTKVSNRFDLVLKASRRARRISLGADPLVSVDNDKCTVIALREIGSGHTQALQDDQPENPVAAARKAFKKELHQLMPNTAIDDDEDGDDLIVDSSELTEGFNEFQPHEADAPAKSDDDDDI